MNKKTVKDGESTLCVWKKSEEAAKRNEEQVFCVFAVCICIHVTMLHGIVTHINKRKNAVGKMKINGTWERKEREKNEEERKKRRMQVKMDGWMCVGEIEL